MGRAHTEDFVFAWKASKFITHWKRLKDTSLNSLDLMECRLDLLGRKAGLFVSASAALQKGSRAARFVLEHAWYTARIRIRISPSKLVLSTVQSKEPGPCGPGALSQAGGGLPA
jgi:hypothetical protein